jgi:hypothetical protein
MLLQFKNKKILTNLLGVLLVAAVLFGKEISQAGIYIEPYLGYESGTNKGEFTVTSLGTSEVDLDVSGLGYGAKLGYSLSNLTFGVDYQMAKLTEKEEGAEDDESDYTDLGVFFSYGMSSFKLNLGYMLNSKIDADDVTLEGSGFKVGVTYSGFSPVNINLDYISSTYDQITVEGVDSSLITDEDLKRSSVMLSVGWAFNL